MLALHPAWRLQTQFTIHFHNDADTIVQCAGLEEAELSSPESAAWTCGLSSGAVTGLVSALPSVS